MTTAETIMAVVHVTAPPEIDPRAIEAELARAISEDPTLPMTAEVAFAEDVLAPRSRDVRRHGFVVALALADEVAAQNVVRRLTTVTQEALRRRFGDGVTSDVDIEMSRAAQAAYWCTLRGTPHRHY